LGRFLAFGIGLLALGIAAVVRSVLATVATMLFFGWPLVFASGIEIAQAVLVAAEQKLSKRPIPLVAFPALIGCVARRH
jgi:uncharacterized membrane protein HdeD (DUF308 family)